MIADGGRFTLHLTATRDGHDHLAQMILAVAAGAAVAQHGVRLPAIRLAALMIRVARSRLGLEHQVPGYVLTEPLTAIFDADLLAVILDGAVAGAEPFGAVLTLPDHRPAATAQPPAMIAARRLAILTNLHAMRPSTLASEAILLRTTPGSG